MARVILVLRFENGEDAGKQLLSYVETAELIVLKKLKEMYIFVTLFLRGREFHLSPRHG